jgi:hypothetical protein
MSGRPRGERQRGPRRRALLFEEVEAAGLPAFFTSFGDRLVYRDGSVYALPYALGPVEVAQLEKVPSAYAATARVGIEYPLVARRRLWLSLLRTRRRAGDRLA